MKARRVGRGGSGEKERKKNGKNEGKKEERKKEMMEEKQGPARPMMRPLATFSFFTLLVTPSSSSLFFPRPALSII